MVFQSYSLYPRMSVEINLSFGLRIAKVAKDEIAKRVAKASRLLQLDPLLKRKPAELSGGQRQRVAIGRALVRNVDVFLFDEPLSNLDAKLRNELRVEIKKLHQEIGNTMIYVTHDQVEALTLADGSRDERRRDPAVRLAPRHLPSSCQPLCRRLYRFARDETIDGSLGQRDGAWKFEARGCRSTSRAIPSRGPPRRARRRSASVPNISGSATRRANATGQREGSRSSNRWAARRSYGRHLPAGWRRSRSQVTPRSRSATTFGFTSTWRGRPFSTARPASAS